MAPPVQVTITDPNGQPITTATNPVTLTLGAGSDGGTLAGTLTQPAVNGVATFSDLAISSAGNYTLQASATGLTSATSNPFTITALPAPPVICNIATAPAIIPVTVTWTTDVPATSCVAYGLTMALGSLSDNLTALTTSHSVTITGLSPLTPYYFSVISDNAFGQQSQSAVATCTTLADTAPPSTSFVDGPADGATVCTSDTTFTWTGTDLVTPTAQLVYAYQLDGNAWSDFSTQTSLDLAGLPDGQHTLTWRRAMPPATSTRIHRCGISP